MTVTPRYQAYPDIHDTGLTVPLQLPDHDHSQLQQENSQRDWSANALQRWACLYHCHQAGVDRVFVDHPLFLDQLNTQGVKNVNTYLQGSDFPDVDLRYSILCQAALAAPILLWHQPADHLEKLRLQALIRRLPQTLSGGLAHYVGLHGATSALAAYLSEQQRVTTKSMSRSPSDGDCSISGPACIIGGIVHSMKLAPDQLAAQRQAHSADQLAQSNLSDIVWPVTAGKIAFIGNDWPCFPLSQRLEHLHSLGDNMAELDAFEAQAPNGATQATNHLACTAANNFEAHMARLLKSARVALCIHNLAYQGIFPQVKLSKYW